MRRTTFVLSLLLASSGVCAQQVAAENCTALPALSSQSSVLAPIAVELTAPLHRLGAPGGVLAQAYDETQSVDRVLRRQSIANCTMVASVTPAPSPGSALPPPPQAPLPAPGAVAMPAASDAEVYQPRTPYDNTPWRFDMSQNGKRMTADAFTAWMKARGVRVARGAAAPAPVTTATATGVAIPTTTATATGVAVPTTTATTTVVSTATMTTPKPAGLPVSPPAAPLSRSNVDTAIPVAAAASVSPILVPVAADIAPVVGTGLPVMSQVAAPVAPVIGQPPGTLAPTPTLASPSMELSLPAPPPAEDAIEADPVLAPKPL